jgi:arylsulfatase A-like enzyme
VDLPCSTSDYFPTVIDALGLPRKQRPQPIDGLSLLPWIAGGTSQRSSPIAFEAGKQRALIGDRYKLISQDAGETFMLFDLLEDRGEARDLAAKKPEIVARMRRELDKWRKSCESSAAGKDYPPD